MSGRSVAIIGGGIVGLATAFKILEKYPETELHLFEKESKVGLHQSGRNSGVLHCGLYYQPGSLKARLAVEGIREMTAFCREYGIDHEICGKVVVATNGEQVATLQNLVKRGEKNGLQGLKILTKRELEKREPNVKGLESLLVPEEGIVSYSGVMEKLEELIISKGGQIHFNSKITFVKNTAGRENLLKVKGQEHVFDWVVNCTGLYSDRIYQSFTTNRRPLRIVPFRGEYLMLNEEAKDLVNHLIYPVPDVKYPFLGVHFTRLISGEREVGPNAVLATKREGYRNIDFSLKDTMESLTYPGLINFLRKNFKFALGEFSSSLSKNAFIKKAQTLVPDIDSSMLVKGTAGVRAQALSPQGELIMDFRVERYGQQVHVLNAPSPGATASLSIAGYIIDKYMSEF